MKHFLTAILMVIAVAAQANTDSHTVPPQA